MSTTDSKQAVLKNRDQFFSFLNIKPSQIAIPVQVHSDFIQIIDKAGLYKNTDALISGTPGVVLSIQTADCFPVFILDPRKNVCALIHSGWRGTAQNIVGKTIEIMFTKFNCQSSNLLVAIGAGIQQRNYQVNLNTAKNFENTFLIPDGKKHVKLDLQSKIIDQLKKTGIKENCIEKDDRCTFEYKELFYSYRRDGSQSGRMMSLIGVL